MRAKKVCEVLRAEKERIKMVALQKSREVVKCFLIIINYKF